MGYDIDSSNKRLIINDAEAEIVQLIFERYGEDNFSYKDIVKELCKKGYKTKVGNDFKKTSLHEILRNEKYRGVYTYNKKSSKDIYGKRNNHKNKSDDEIIRIPDGCPRIISDELWDKVQSRLANNEIRTYSTEERYLLRNKIFCGECGERMYGNRRKSGKNKKLYVTYNCAGRQKGNGCMNKGINREYIEKFVMVQIRSAFLPKNKAKTITTNLNEYIKYRDSDLEKSLDEYRRKKQNTQAKIKRLVNSIANGISADIVADNIASLKKQKANWESKIEETKLILSQQKIKVSDVENAMSHYYELMNSDEVIVRKFIDRYVEKVIVFQDHIEIILNVNRQIANPVTA